MAERDASRPDPGPAPRPRLSRRTFLGTAGGAVAGAALVAGADTVGPAPGAGAAGSAPGASGEPFYGRHQGGIAGAPQAHSSFAAFDVTTDRRAGLVDLLRAWTAVAARLTAGRPAGALSPDDAVVEPDSGEALGLGPARLTVNVGFGPSLFGMGAPDRFGLAARRPVPLVPLPAFPGDELTEQTSGGDLTVHACADDPQVAFHAVRQLARQAEGVASLRWAQAGWHEQGAGTPRNLTGFKDGTRNLTTAEQLDDFVWVKAGQDQAWLAGGTYLVVRRVRLNLPRWDAQTLGAQERAIGRHKQSGAPLGARAEGDPLDLDAVGPGGAPVIPLNAHVRLASPQDNWNQQLRRRSFSYQNDVVAPAGAPATVDAGVFFVSYQHSPRLAFIPIFEKLAAHDALHLFTTHTASAVAALPPAAPGPGHWIGEGLFA